VASVGEMGSWAREEKPNIVLVLVDDLGWRDLGCYGSAFYETPVLDRLAAQGMRFTDAYAASPVCSPTRASIMTGKYPARLGITNWIGGHAVGRLCDVPSFSFLPQNEYTLARALRDAGYATWHVGKWHLGGREFWPERHGFDVNIGGCEWGRPMYGYFSPYHCPALEDGPPGEYLTDRLTDEAVRLIETAGDRPFFLNFWPYAVHTPLEAPGPLVAKYQDKASAMGLDRLDPFEEGEAFPFWQKRHLRVRRRRLQSDPTYAAMVENLDWNLGRLLQVLERSGKARQTCIVVTSDNGGLATAEGSPTSNAPLSEGKGWVYEGGVREPLIVSWQGVVEPGGLSTATVTSPDLYPTLLDIAGAKLRPGQACDGVSFLPALLGEAFERGPVFWYYPHYSNQGGEPAAAMRDGPWKFVRFYDGGRQRLYNLAEDISEQEDLAVREPGLTKALARQLDEWCAALGASSPAPNPFPPFPDVPGDSGG
jgi:arylsulfatase A-like enzyme